VCEVQRYTEDILSFFSSEILCVECRDIIHKEQRYYVNYTEIIMLHTFPSNALILELCDTSSTFC